MKKQQIITTGKNLEKKPTGKARAFILSAGLYNLDHALADFGKHLNTRNNNGKQTPEFYKSYENLSMMMGLDTHYPIINTVPEKYAPFLLGVIRNIIREYNCTTSLEKAVAENIAGAHIKTIYYSKILNDNIGKNSIGVDGVDFLEMIGKELDRANRQLNSSILTLRQIKAPPTSFKITATNAFIGQNQQVNNNKKDEINERQ